MRLLPLHGGGVAGVDDADHAVVSQYRWTLHQNSPSRTRATRYAVARVEGRRVYLHLFLWRLWGRPPVPVVAHRDGDGLHCTQENLRDATVTQNNQQRGIIRSNTSGFKGVNWDKRSCAWRAKISVEGKRLHLGYFEHAIDAARAYDAAAKLHHGEFAVLNLKGEHDDACGDRSASDRRDRRNGQDAPIATDVEKRRGRPAPRCKAAA